MLLAGDAQAKQFVQTPAVVRHPRVFRTRRPSVLPARIPDSRYL